MTKGGYGAWYRGYMVPGGLAKSTEHLSRDAEFCRGSERVGGGSRSI